MTYTSFFFYILIAVSVILYYILPKKIRYVALLLGSLSFYYFACDNVLEIALFVFSAVASYVFGLLFKKKNRAVLIIGILVSVIPLLTVKLCGFLPQKATSVKDMLIVPVGLAFYSLQIVSYLVDVYKERIVVQKNPLKYLLYISFFPTIIQGPIHRYHEISEELYEGHGLKKENIMRGIQMIIWGFFLKYMIADKAAVFVNAVFDTEGLYEGIFVWIAAILYSIQLYTDFMACVYLSKGCAGLFGINLRDNFKRPYFSGSVKEFWRRWHISLSEWLRDYIYIPLGGNRKGKTRKYLNLLITFAVSGIWHGSGIKFLLWGILHGIYQIAGDLSKKIQGKVLKFLKMGEDTASGRFVRILLTDFLVMIAWVLFRASDVKQAAGLLGSMFSRFNPWILFDDSLYALGLVEKEWVVLIVSIAILFLTDWLREKGKDIIDWFNAQFFLIRWIIYILLICSIWVFGTYGFGFDATAFIYGGF